MTQSFTYDGDALTTVHRESVELVEKADHGDTGSGHVTIYDDDGTLAIVGHKEFVAEQSACSVARTFTGYVSQRTYRRGETEMVGAGREIEMTLVDLNARLGFKVIRGAAGKRPAETIDDRLTWLLGSSFLTGLVADFGFVDYPTDDLDANDYRGQFPQDVLRDMALVAGVNFFVYWDEDEAAAGLWFRDSNASTAFQSTLRISNVMSDIDQSTTFPASQEAELSRDPSEVVSGVLVPYARSYTYRTRAATEDTYEPRDGVAPNATIKRRAKARDLGDAFLFRRRNEEDVITDRLRLPAAKVNLVRAGQRIQCRYSHFDTEGYGEFAWFRVLERGVMHPLNDDNTYDVRLVMSPQEPPCSVQPTFIQKSYQDGAASQHSPDFTEDYDYDDPTTPGNLLVVATMSPASQAAAVTATPSGWTWLVQNAETGDGGAGDGYFCNIFCKESEGDTGLSVQYDDADGGRRVLLLEYAGLTNPRAYAAAVTNLQDPGVGYGTIPATSYPSGPSAVLAFCFQEDGPTGTDNQTASGTGLTLRNAIAGALHGVVEIGLGDLLRDGSSGTTPLYPAAGGWRLLFTGTGPTLSIGLVFVGDNC